MIRTGSGKCRAGRQPVANEFAEGIGTPTTNRAGSPAGAHRVVSLAKRKISSKYRNTMWLMSGTGAPHLVNRVP
jgi:hypothetical protein